MHQSLVQVAVLLSSLSLLAHSEYVRPIDEDCIPQELGGLGGVDGSLFPEQYIMDGTSNPESSYVTEVDTASGFSVTYYDTYKVAENKLADESYVLYQCGTDKPDVSATGVPKGAKFFEIPLTSLSVPETVPYAFVEQLGLDDRVYDVSQFVTGACGQKLLECGDVAPDTFSGYLSNLTALESTAGSSVDGIMATSAQEYPKIFSFSATEDPGVLNRAEWIKFLGLFFNRDAYASNIYDGIVQSYNDIKAKANVKGESKPVVAWVSHFVFQDDEHYEVKLPAYQAEFVSDSGAQNVDLKEIEKQYPGVTVSDFSPTTLEFAWDKPTAFKSKEDAQKAFLEFLSTVDVIIDETYSPEPASYTFEQFQKEYGLENADSDALEKLSWLEPRLIFRPDGLISASNGLDWFEGAIARPDLVLQDVDRVADSARQGKLLKKNEFKWIRNIDESPVVISAKDCERLTSCNEKPATICPFVKICDDGSTSLLEESSVDSGDCVYQTCIKSEVESEDSTENTAQMAAPAVILLTLLIVFVEALINFC